jgi:hypothetical protein
LSPNSPWARRHCLDQLWSLPRDINKKFGTTTTGSFIMTVHPPTNSWKPQNLWLTITWILFPIVSICQT